MKEIKSPENESLKEGKDEQFNNKNNNTTTTEWQNRTFNTLEWKSGLYGHLSFIVIYERQYQHSRRLIQPVYDK